MENIGRMCLDNKNISERNNIDKYNDNGFELYKNRALHRKEKVKQQSFKREKISFRPLTMIESLKKTGNGRTEEWSLEQGNVTQERKRKDTGQEELKRRENKEEWLAGGV